MKKKQVYGKPVVNTPVNSTIIVEKNVRNAKGHFTGEKVASAVPNPAYHEGSLDKAVFVGAYPETGWRGMKGDRRPSVNGNTYVGRQRSGRIKRNFGNEGKVARIKGNAASFADSSESRQRVLTLKAPTMTGGEDNFIGQAARIEMDKRLAERAKQLEEASRC